MFFPVARLRLTLVSALLLFSSFPAHTKEPSVITSSVSYCSDPQEILVEQFDIAYFPTNNSISFNVSAASVLADLNVTAQLYLNPFNGILCPLPQYNFTGWDNLQLPSSVVGSITSHLPGIAYVMPDLEAFAQLTLFQENTNQVVACLQTTVSNGWSARQYAVEWSTAALTLLALASAIWKSITSDALSLAPMRLLDFVALLQTIARPSGTSGMQNSITRMRRLTGGDSSDASSGDSTAYVNRQLSPYNIVSSMPTLDLRNATARSLIKVGNAALNTTSRLLKKAQADVAVVTNDQSSDVLQAGVPIYRERFMTVFLTALIYTAAAWGLRSVLVAVFPLLIFVFFQWTLHDSWLSILLSVITLVILMGLEASVPASLSLAPLAAPFRQERCCMVIAFGHSDGLGQAIVFLIVDVLFFLSLGYLAIVRMVCSGLLLAFVQTVSLAPIPRVVIGVITAVIFAVAVIVMFINMLDVVCCGHRRRKGDRALATADGPSAQTPGSSQYYFVDRPGNPTPPETRTNSHAHTHLDTPDSGSPMSTSVGSERPSVLTNSTGTTLGDLLPRRWSFQHSRPPSASEPSPGAVSFHTPSTPSTPASSHPPTSQRHSRHPSASVATHSPIRERYSDEREAHAF
ncbi:uncharacterized protein B0H18DRAFT_975758 [Fomitopsis serialis]|uniref:uncharacterized protein n=1 Tax=Fomitopsis serialis TaxID=139415 RepID=UPI002008609D|nr:uncharacterized protein B0H18DRAFT_975758 [Neoantrodia serialis]KAH9935453.1 hypothetical protein B0H18DRAFT_975758 [Neoantrodia serialis]